MRAKISILLLTGLAILLCQTSARADLGFVLASPAQSGVGTNEVFSTGTLTNTSLTDNLFLNNIQFNFNGTATNYLTADTNIFFANVPGILLPGETYNGVVFGVTINSATSPGNYSGTVAVQGGADIFAENNLGSQPFQISLPPAILDIALCGTNLVLFWPSPPGDFVLQQNSDLTTTNWLAVTSMPALTNGLNQVILSPSATNEFYRLEYP